jgi:voltage-gated potassium channel
MSDQGEPDRPAGSGGPAGPDKRGGRDGGGAERGGSDRGGRAEAESAGSEGDGRAEVGQSDGDADNVSRLPVPARIAIGVLGPTLLTTAYFTLPFEPIGPDHPVLAWAICAGLLTLLAVGMVVTTNQALTDRGRFGHPGVGVLLLSWAAILVFAASYWAMATRHDQFVGLQTRLDALYFTGVTMATVGYGDIHPSGQLARAIVLVQLVYTFAFLVSGVTAIRTRNQAKRARRMRAGG